MVTALSVPPRGSVWVFRLSERLKFQATALKFISLLGWEGRLAPATNRERQVWGSGFCRYHHAAAGGSFNASTSLRKRVLSVPPRGSGWVAAVPHSVRKGSAFPASIS
jgi:hypothetical protein